MHARDEHFNESPGCGEDHGEANGPKQSFDEDGAFEFIGLFANVAAKKDDGGYQRQGRKDRKQVRDVTADEMAVKELIDHRKQQKIKDDNWNCSIPQPTLCLSHVFPSGCKSQVSLTRI
ncbi:MAG: hypothetical protein WBD87_13580 [Candidatus Acidiferrales bacterium]